MATRKAQRTQTDLVDTTTGEDLSHLPDDAQQLLRRALAEGEEIAQGEWLKFPRIGCWVVGHVLGIVTPDGNGRVTDPYLRLALPDGTVRPCGLGGNLSTLVNAGMVGRRVTIMYVTDREIGKKSPMKVYKLIDHGGSWPTYADDWRPEFAAE